MIQRKIAEKNKNAQFVQPEVVEAKPEVVENVIIDYYELAKKLKNEAGFENFSEKVLMTALLRVSGDMEAAKRNLKSEAYRANGFYNKHLYN